MLLIAKFYDLHVGEGIAPPTALKRAQEWLRTASRETLIDYARDAAIKGKVDAAKWATLEDYLRHPDKLSASRARVASKPGRQQQLHKRTRRPRSSLLLVRLHLFRDLTGDVKDARTSRQPGGKGGFADGEERSRNDAVENRSASIG